MNNGIDENFNSPSLCMHISYNVHVYAIVIDHTAETFVDSA